MAKVPSSKGPPDWAALRLSAVMLMFGASPWCTVELFDVDVEIRRRAYIF